MLLKGIIKTNIDNKLYKKISFLFIISNKYEFLNTDVWSYIAATI